MKKIILLLVLCFCAFSMCLFPVQAQEIIVLNFDGGGPNCTSWITGYYPQLTASISGSESIRDQNRAGGIAPECSLFPSAVLTIGFSAASSFSLRSAGNGPIRVQAFNDSTSIFDSGSVSTGAVMSYSGAVFDTLVITAGAGGLWVDDIIIETTVQRLNHEDLSAPVALFCAETGGLDIYNIVGEEGVFFRRISPQALADGIEVATGRGRDVRLMNTSLIVVWALSTGEVQINSGDYEFRMSYQDACGGLPESTFVISESEDAGDTGVIIDQPR